MNHDTSAGLLSFPKPFYSAAGRLWNYQLVDIPGVIETGWWYGAGSHGLKPHFHDEAQLTLVTSGFREFRIEDTTVCVTAGQGILIPAGMVHTPLATTDPETSCINLYVSIDRVAASFKVFDISRDPVSAHGVFSDNILCFLSNALSEASVHPAGNAISVELRAALTSSDKRIGEIAAGFDRSRAGFSRQVTRELGLAPHTFRLLSRLNHARQLLREGQSIAAVATEAGFSDQSHMTRLFRRTFGTTPGLYRRS